MSDQDPEERSAPGVRNTLVSSIATNIFDTLKSNDDIAAILNDVLDPSRTDKVDRNIFPDQYNFQNKAELKHEEILIFCFYFRKT